MSFLRFWAGFTMFGVAAAVLLLIWSFRARQFREPDRAACLPLADAPPAAVPEVRWSREAVVLLAFLGVGLLVLAATVGFSLVW